MQRQVYVSGRIKAMNESIYYNVDAIHNAISENKKIRVQYYQWNVKKETELRHNGAWYHISPWGLLWEDENYFTVSVNVHVSRQFLGWVFSLGEGVKIISPDDVVDEMKQEIERLIR